MKKRKRNVILAMAGIVILGAGGYGLHYLNRYQQYKTAMKEIKINEIDLKAVKDGSYIGEYDVDFISAKVQVNVENHKISDIKYIYHKNDRGEKADIIIKDIVEKQKIKVDTISGATNSSKVIQKAVELALLNP